MILGDGVLSVVSEGQGFGSPKKNLRQTMKMVTDMSFRVSYICLEDHNSGLFSLIATVALELVISLPVYHSHPLHSLIPLKTEYHFQGMYLTWKLLISVFPWLTIAFTMRMLVPADLSILTFYHFLAQTTNSSITNLFDLRCYFLLFQDSSFLSNSNSNLSLKFDIIHSSKAVIC